MNFHERQKQGDEFQDQRDRNMTVFTDALNVNSRKHTYIDASMWYLRIDSNQHIWEGQLDIENWIESNVTQPRNHQSPSSLIMNWLHVGQYSLILHWMMR